MRSYFRNRFYAFRSVTGGRGGPAAVDDYLLAGDVSGAAQTDFGCVLVSPPPKTRNNSNNSNNNNNNNSYHYDNNSNDNNRDLTLRSAAIGDFQRPLPLAASNR